MRKLRNDCDNNLDCGEGNSDNESDTGDSHNLTSGSNRTHDSNNLRSGSNRTVGTSNSTLDGTSNGTIVTNDGSNGTTTTIR